MKILRKIMLVMVAFLLLLSFVSCSEEDDSSAPATLIPGNDGLIIANYLSSTSLELHWTKATDDITPATNLQYLVYYSASGNIKTVVDMEANGFPLGSYTKNINLKTVSGLVSGSPSYFNIIVKDEDENKTAYLMKMSSYEPLPVPGNNGSISILGIATNSISMNWVKAVDDATPQFALQYLVYYSTNANMSSVADIEANGTPVGDYEYDITTKAVTNLNYGTLYYFNLIVQDEDGNKGSFAEKTNVVRFYSVVYHGNDSTSGMPPEAAFYTNSQVVTVAGNTGSMVGTLIQDGIRRSFVWNTQADGNGTDYALASGTFTMGSANVTLYAKWSDSVLRGTGPAGGLVFYDKGSYSDGWRYLEAAPSDQSGGLQWYNGIYTNTGATATAIGTGQTNTALIITVQGAGSYAAQLCSNLTSGGYSDWFLPSKDELNKMYLNLQSGTDENSVVYTPVGGFAGSYYWSSSEDDDYNDATWMQYFINGDQGYGNKNGAQRVRVVRAF